MLCNSLKVIGTRGKDLLLFKSLEMQLKIRGQSHIKNSLHMERLNTVQVMASLALASAIFLSSLSVLFLKIVSFSGHVFAIYTTSVIQLPQ